jgi:hypothetical protein
VKVSEIGQIRFKRMRLIEHVACMGVLNPKEEVYFKDLGE